MTSTILDPEILHEAARDALRRIDLGTFTTAAPDLYPHQWSWVAAFIATGLARVDVRRAITELRSLLTLSGAPPRSRMCGAARRIAAPAGRT
jgi:hypothetical protein